MNDSYAFLKRIVLGIYYDFSKDAIAVLDKFKANDNNEEDKITDKTTQALEAAIKLHRMSLDPENVTDDYKVRHNKTADDCFEVISAALEAQGGDKVLQIAKLIQETIDGKSPMSKWMTNQHVKTLDDLEWWAQTQLEEVMILQGAKQIEGEDLTDWLSGKSSILNHLVQNIHAVKKQQPDQSRLIAMMKEGLETIRDGKMVLCGESSAMQNQDIYTACSKTVATETLKACAKMEKNNV